MIETLTWDEIKHRYPDEYVVLVEAKWDSHLPEVHAGIVLGHSKSSKDLLASLKGAVTGQEWTILYTGEVGSGNYLF